MGFCINIDAWSYVFIMKLSEAKACGKYLFLGCLDDNISERLFSYGFFVGVEVVILTMGKFGYVVDCLGTKYTINKSLAEVVLLKSVN